MFKILVFVYLFTFPLFSKGLYGTGVICKFPNILNYSKYVIYIFKEKAIYYAFNQKREKIYLHEYLGYDYGVNSKFILIGNNFLRINKKTMGLISSEDQHVGTCILFKSSSELMEELEVLKKVEQKKLNK